MVRFVMHLSSQPIFIGAAAHADLATITMPNQKLQCIHLIMVCCTCSQGGCIGCMAL